MQYRPDLDGLRAVAVTLVLLYHATFPIPGAFLGVDIFFTLSGFLITTLTTNSLNKNTFTLSSFYIRRSLRLIPAALTVATLTALTAIGLLPLHRARQILVSSIAAIASVSNVRYLLQSGYFDAEAVTKPLLHTWSLAVEEQFYLVWPFLLLFAHRYLPPRAPLFFCVLGVIISPYLSHLLLQKHPAAAFYLAPARFYEFLLGAALSYIPPSSNSLIHQTFGIAGSVGLLASVAFISSADPFPSWCALAPCVATAFLIHAGPQSFISKCLSFQPFVFIGTISYSVYLVHWPVVVFYRLLVGQNDVFSMRERFFMLISAVILGYALNVLVEKRFRLSKAESDPQYTPLGESDANNMIDTCSHRSKHACRRLFGVVMLVQLGLFFSVGVLSAQESREVQLVSQEALVNYGNESYTSGDDYNGLDVESVVRLAAEVTGAISGVVRSEEAPTGKSFYYENGSLLNKYMKREGPTPDIPRIVIAGDSHARHWKSLAYHLSKEFNAHVEIWTVNGCSLLFGALHVFLGKPEFTEPCRIALRIWKRRFVAEPYDTVVISGRWAYLTEEEQYGRTEASTKVRAHLLLEETAPKEKQKRPSDDEWASVNKENRRMFQKSLLGTVKFLNGLGSRVVLMNQIPVLKKSPGHCTSYPDAQMAISAGRQPERCVSVTREQVLSRLEYTGTVMNRVKSTLREMVDVVFPSDLLCDNYLQDREHCRVVLKDKLLYRDFGHLNEFGAAFYALRWKATGYNGVPWTFRRKTKQL